MCLRQEEAWTSSVSRKQVDGGWSRSGKNHVQPCAGDRAHTFTLNDYPFKNTISYKGPVQQLQTAAFSVVYAACCLGCPKGPWRQTDNVQWTFMTGILSPIQAPENMCGNLESPQHLMARVHIGQSLSFTSMALTRRKAPGWGPPQGQGQVP